MQLFDYNVFMLCKNAHMQAKELMSSSEKKGHSKVINKDYVLRSVLGD